METGQTPTSNPCRHHWLLGQPKEGVVSGVCRKCGASRDYPAVLDEDWLYGPLSRESTQVESPGTGGGGARPYTGVRNISLLADSPS
jgi:hypothetical protein